MNSFNEITSVLSWNDSNYKEWRTRFNHFYRVRRSEEFQKEYYKYLLDNKEVDISFDQVFTSIKLKTNRMEASFSSKLLATINPQKPVWDTEVLKKLHMKAPYLADRNREIKIIQCYNKIEEWYANELRSPRGKEMTKIFDEKMGQLDITGTKKVDLMLWQLDR